MTPISPHDLTTQLPTILSRVARGEEFVVTDHGQPVARIGPPPQATPARPDAALGQDDWLARFNAWMQDVDARAGRYSAGFTLDDSRDSIYDGRGA
jgi:antitoxin (DNA-binding transcriptional repressor) of toxin-antitoxin stability system